MLDLFPNALAGFEAVPAYQIDRSTDVGVWVSSTLIDPVIDYLLHDEVLRAGLSFALVFVALLYS